MSSLIFSLGIKSVRFNKINSDDVQVLEIYILHTLPSLYLTPIFSHYKDKDVAIIPCMYHGPDVAQQVMGRGELRIWTRRLSVMENLRVP